MPSLFATPRISPDSACRSAGSLLLFIGGAALLLASDLALKYWAMENAPRQGMIPLAPYLLAIAWTENHGMVFGLAEGRRWLFVCASLVAAVVITAFFCASTRRERVLHAALALILAGALGNLYDRIVYGFVRDMLYLFPGVHLPFGLRWPGHSGRELYPWIFNLADVFLLVGIVLILGRSILAPPAPTAKSART